MNNYEVPEPVLNSSLPKKARSTGTLSKARNSISARTERIGASGKVVNDRGRELLVIETRVKLVNPGGRNMQLSW